MSGGLLDVPTAAGVGLPRPRRSPVPLHKTEVPAPPTNLVARQRLVDLLGPTDPQPDVTLLCGPAGSGKTTLVADWARSRPDAPDTAVAWVSLSVQDNDLSVLWSSVLLSFERSGAWFADSALHSLPAPRHVMGVDFLGRLEEAFADATPGPVVLVLDDLQEIRDPEALRSLDLLLRYPPHGLRFVLSSRYAPPLALPRLRLEGRVRDIGPVALGFTATEADMLLRSHDVSLSGEDLDKLLIRTEGWAAGMRLAAMSFGRGQEPSGLIDRFAADDRAVADYLVGEMLGHLDERVLDFLHCTCVCSRFTPGLAAALSRRQDAAKVLSELERMNFPVSRLGDDWYRYHPMLQQYLTADLALQRPSDVPGLHALAARWFEERGEVLTAAEHAAQAADVDLLVDVLTRSGLALVTAGDGDGLRRVLARTGRDVQHPALGAIAAVAALDALDLPCAVEALPPASDGATAEAGGALGAVRAAVALGIIRSQADSLRLLDALADDPRPTGDPDADMLLGMERGRSLLWLGRPVEAEAELTAALLLARREGRDWAALQCLGALVGASSDGGRLDAAEQRAEEALVFAAQQGWADSAPSHAARTTLGWLAHLRLDEAVAEDLALTVLSGAAGALDPGVELAARLLEAAARYDRGDEPYAVVRRMRDAWRGSLQPPPPHVVAVAALDEQRMAFGVGSPAWAAEVEQRTVRLLGDGAEAALLAAVNQAYRGRPRNARQVLAPVLAGRAPAASPTTLVAARVWEARLASRVDDEQHATAALADAVALAAPARLLRPFLHGGSEVADLLSERSGTFGHDEAFVDEVRAAVSGRRAGTGAMLTSRELGLLRALPSMLTAEEIAGSLFLSVNTVKTHLRGIYRKLEVNNRRDAVQSARRRGLL